MLPEKRAEKNSVHFHSLPTVRTICPLGGASDPTSESVASHKTTHPARSGPDILRSFPSIASSQSPVLQQTESPPINLQQTVPCSSPINLQETGSESHPVILQHAVLESPPIILQQTRAITSSQPKTSLQTQPAVSPQEVQEQGEPIDKPLCYSHSQGIETESSSSELPSKSVTNRKKGSPALSAMTGRVFRSSQTSLTESTDISSQKTFAKSLPSPAKQRTSKTKSERIIDSRQTMITRSSPQSIKSKHLVGKRFTRAKK